MEIDLKISEDLLKYLGEVLEIDQNFCRDLLLCRGPIKEGGPDVWSLTAIFKDQAEEMLRGDHATLAIIQGKRYILTSPEFSHELAGKYLDWNENGMELIDVA